MCVVADIATVKRRLRVNKLVAEIEVLAVLLCARSPAIAAIAAAAEPSTRSAASSAGAGAELEHQVGE